MVMISLICLVIYADFNNLCFPSSFFVLALENFQEMDRDFATNQIQQFSEKKRMPDTLTASNGRPLEDLTTSMTAGKRGPIVLKVLLFLIFVHFLSGGVILMIFGVIVPRISL